MQLKYRPHILKVCCMRLVVTMAPVDIASAVWSVTVRSWINGCQLLTCLAGEAERVKFIISSKGSPNSRTFEWIEWRGHVTALHSRPMEPHSWYFGLFISCCIVPWMHPEIPLLRGTAERWRNLFLTSMNLCLHNHVCRFVYFLRHLIILRLDFKPWNSILDHCCAGIFI